MTPKEIKIEAGQILARGVRAGGFLSPADCNRAWELELFWSAYYAGSPAASLDDTQELLKQLNKMRLSNERG